MGPRTLPGLTKPRRPRPGGLAPLVYATVPKLWPGGTILCAASGPSLTREDLEACRGLVDATVVVNDVYQVAPWADVLYAADERWWHWHRGAPLFTGRKYSLSQFARRYKGVEVLQNTGRERLELKPTGLRSGRNSGYQAIGLAVHLGAKRILLLGYDLSLGPQGEKHYFGDHPAPASSPFEKWRPIYATLVEPLAAAGVEVVNCTRRTRLECFPRSPLETELARLEAERTEAAPCV